MPLLSHFSSQTDQSDKLVWTSLILSVALIPFVVVRVFASLKMHKLLGAEDVFICCSALCAELLGVLLLLCCAAGFGRHSYDLTTQETINTLRYFYGVQIAYKLSIGLTKLSVLSFYLGLFKVHKTFGRVCRGLMGLVTAWSLAVILLTVFQCDPIREAWEGPIDHNAVRSCINIKASWYGTGVSNIILDVMVVLLPMTVIRSLQVSMRQKLQLCGILSLGFAVCLFSILRVTTLNSGADMADPTWAPVQTGVWSVCEVDSGIMVACIPVIKGFFKRKRSGNNLSFGISRYPGTQLNVIAYPGGRSVRTSITGPWSPTLPQRIYSLTCRMRPTPPANAIIMRREFELSSTTDLNADVEYYAYAGHRASTSNRTDCSLRYETSTLASTRP